MTGRNGFHCPLRGWLTVRESHQLIVASWFAVLNNEAPLTLQQNLQTLSRATDFSHFDFVAMSSYLMTIYPPHPTPDLKKRKEYWEYQTERFGSLFKVMVYLQSQCHCPWALAHVHEVWLCGWQPEWIPCPRCMHHGSLLCEVICGLSGAIFNPRLLFPSLAFPCYLFQSAWEGGTGDGGKNAVSFKNYMANIC